MGDFLLKKIHTCAYGTPEPLKGENRVVRTVLTNLVDLEHLKILQIEFRIMSNRLGCSKRLETIGYSSVKRFMSLQ